MRLLSVYYTHKPGGFCKRLYRLLNACVSAGFEVHYASLDTPPTSLSQRVNFHRIPFPCKSRRGVLFWLLFVLYCPLYLLYLSTRLGPDRFAVFGAFYSAMLIPARAFSRKPLTLFFRSLVFKINASNKLPAPARALSNLLDRIGAWNASLIVCMSKAMQADLIEFLGYTPKQLALLPNDVPAVKSAQASSPTISLPKARLKILAAGVLDQRKNIGLLIEACLGLSQEQDMQDVLLIVAGDGPRLSEYQELARAHNAKNIIFLGWCAELHSIFPLVDLFVHPAQHEGMSNSVLEALAADVPILLARTRESQEFCDDHRLLFELGQVESLRDRLASISKDELEVLRSASKKLQQRFTFDWDKVAVELLSSPR